MNASAPSSTDPQPDTLVAERSADLSELLGHLTTCWDDDRRLLARKLHDTLGSSMTALTMHLALLTQQLPQEKVLQDRAAQMKQLLMNIIGANRDMQLALWNDKLEFLGIKAAISELVSEFGAAHPIKARASLPDDEASYPREVGVALLRCAEEGLRNVLAHSQASEVEVILDDDGDAVTLTVRDDGVGPAAFDPNDQRCHGLRLLRERASFLGGALSVAANGARGTRLTLTLPLPGLSGA